MPTTETQIILDATPAQTWRVLSNFEAYDQWNPYITIEEGTADEGAAVQLRKSPTNKSVRTETGKILILEDAKVIEWQTIAFFKWLYTASHRFELQELPDGKTRFINTAIKRGILSRLVTSKNQLTLDLRSMNDALEEQLRNQNS